MTKWIVKSLVTDAKTGYGKTKTETVNSNGGIFDSGDRNYQVKSKYENFWNQDKYGDRVHVVSVNKVEEKEREYQQQRPSILGNSSFGFDRPSKSKRPNILNMSMPNILRRR